tara:strand:- start:2 stop:1819 length:1818 start_codon:yes stop_codon:yes gene_type:complete
MGTYVNNLRLLEITTGDESGTWGTKTNTNLELIADAFGSGTEAITTNADTHTTTIADGAADEGRALFLKYTGTLDSACTITIAPNTVNKLWFIENATSGSQNIIISQGSGANITIANGKVAAVYTDGAGSGAAVLDVFADLEISSTLTVAGNVTMSADATVGDDLTLLSDAAVLGFGADTDVTLTHVADTGLLLNSTMAIQFNDASQYINAPSNAILDINATDEIELNATLADVNANLDVSGTIVGASTIEGTTITATTAFVPDASDGAALGTASLEFSDLFLADEAVISFGDDDDVTLTHVADTGLLLNSTMALQFNDASQYINAPSATVLDINATDEIELNATAVDLNGTLDVSGATTLGADLSVPATSKIYLDGGSNTYIHESSGDTMRFFCGGTSRFQIQADGVMIPSGAYLYLDNGGNTYITEGSADVMRFFAGGSKQFECSGTNLSVVGALSKGSGSFRIDHPLDSMKDTHDLVHSFIEGPRADLIYRGSVQLSEGTATVDLDDAATMTNGTWELLCRDPQVWVQNEDGWTQVRGSVSGSTLTITAQDGDCTDTVSWLVVAERQDEHMMDTNWTDNNGRVIVEPEKPAEDEEEAEDDGE